MGKSKIAAKLDIDAYLEFYDKVFQVQDNLEIEYRREREGVEEECLLLDKRFRKKSDKYDEDLAHIRRDIYGEK